MVKRSQPEFYMCSSCFKGFLALFFWFLFFNPCDAQEVRSFSYPGSHHFIVGETISPLIPVFTGAGQVPDLLDTEVRLYGFKKNQILNGALNVAAFQSPQVICSEGTDLYITDAGGKMVRKINAAGTVSTLAGSTVEGYVDDKGTAARFEKITSMVARNGYVYLTEQFTRVIRMISPTGVVTTIAGSGQAGAADGEGRNASFSTLVAITVDGSRNLFVADNGNKRIRKISPGGTVSTHAGLEAMDLVAAPNGDLFVLGSDQVVYRLSAEGTKSAFAGGGGFPARLDGEGTKAIFLNPQSICMDESGNLYVFEVVAIRKITPAGTVSTLAGTGMYNQVFGLGKIAGFQNILSGATDGRGNLILVDVGNIDLVSVKGWSVSPELPLGLSLDRDGRIQGVPLRTGVPHLYTVTGSTLLGSQKATLSLAVSHSPGLPALSYPASVVLTVNQEMTPVVPVNTGGTVFPEFYRTAVDYVGSGYHQINSGVGRSASLSAPASLFFNGENIYVMDQDNAVVEISKYRTTRTVAGGMVDWGLKNGRGLSVLFNQATGITGSAAGDLYVADRLNHVIRKIDPSGLVSTFAGTGRRGHVNGVAVQATFNSPYAVVCDGQGNVFVADEGNHAVRKITPDGLVSTFAGGTMGYLDGLGATARFNGPTGLAFDGAGNLLVVDKGNFRIRKISLSGEVSTLAGNGNQSATDGQGSSAGFLGPENITAADQGNFYVTDQNLVRKISDSGMVSTFTEVLPFENPLHGSTGTSVRLHGITYDPAGYLYVSDFMSGTVRKISMQGYHIFPKLPEGVSMSTNGTISGRPLAAFPSTEYTITAHNGSGTATSRIRFEVSVMPLIQTFSPSSAATGTSIAIRGLNLKGVTAVSFGGVPASLFREDQLGVSAVVGAGASGEIRVSTAGGVAVLPGFVYLEPVVSIPLDNFKIAVTGLSCRGRGDGSVRISADRVLNYNAVLTGGKGQRLISFSSRDTLSGLDAGTYSLCITVTGMVGYKQCFSVVVEEPGELLVSTAVRQQEGLLDIELSGAERYYVVLNGQDYSTAGDLLSLPLVAGNNKLSVSTDKLCQGQLEKTIFLPDRVVIYPNPVEDRLYISLAVGAVAPVRVNMYEVGSGRLVKSQNFPSHNGLLEVPVSGLNAGVYTLVLRQDERETTHKIIKR